MATMWTATYVFPPERRIQGYRRFERYLDQVGRSRLAAQGITYPGPGLEITGDKEAVLALVRLTMRSSIWGAYLYRFRGFGVLREVEHDVHG